MNFSVAFEHYTNLILSNEPFALSRYGDGEVLVVLGETVGKNNQAFKIDRWQSDKNDTKFRKVLFDSLQHTESNFHYGIPTPTDPVPDRDYAFLKESIKNKNITFANLFINANYRKWKNFLAEMTKEVVVIANKKAEFPFPCKSYEFMDDCVRRYEQDPSVFDSYIQLAQESGQTFFISAGPAANVLIHEMYKLNPNNQYIDVGSSLDEFVHKRKTRPYMYSDSNYSSLESTFPCEKVSVILNGFKRPEMLTEQIKALKNSTVVPEEILIWYNNPGVGSPVNSDVVHNHSTCFSRENFGVWSRFFFAFNAKSPYVCIFDDDVIPGSRWLENCLNTMNKKEALLGTNGILWKDDSNEYTSKVEWIGWTHPNKETREVDIVGHSWFFKREWLSYFTRELHDPVEHRIHGEDMHFSFMLQKYANIPTMVPPHPPENKEMWGNTVGGAVACDANAISNTQGSWEKFSNYWTQQRRAGWRLLFED